MCDAGRTTSNYRLCCSHEDCTRMVIPAPAASRRAPTVEFTSSSLCLPRAPGAWVREQCAVVKDGRSLHASKQQCAWPSVLRRGTTVLSTGTDRQWRLSSQIRTSTISKFYHTVWKERLANFNRQGSPEGWTCVYIYRKERLVYCVLS